jgi:hypothetical protein
MEAKDDCTGRFHANVIHCNCLQNIALICENTYSYPYDMITGSNSEFDLKVIALSPAVWVS